MQIRPEEIPLVARLVDELCGIVLDGSKGYLIENRLLALAEELRAANFSDFCRKVRAAADPTLRLRIIDAITTQETLFFRDASPFDALRHKVLPELIDAKSHTVFPKRLRIWSAGCSTGQEPYSLAMLLWELLGDPFLWDVSILATDISNSAIKTASTGRYAAHEIQRGMPAELLRKYFHQEAGGWRVHDNLRALVTFQRRNLLEPFGSLGPFDVIFCRNVAIYFEPQARRDLFIRLADRLTPEGALFTGSSEMLNECGPQFVPLHHCRTVFYQPQRKPPPPIRVPAGVPLAAGPAAGGQRPLYSEPLRAANASPPRVPA